jgi:hypothetical protein
VAGWSSKFREYVPPFCRGFCEPRQQTPVQNNNNNNNKTKEEEEEEEEEEKKKKVTL